MSDHQWEYDPLHGHVCRANPAVKPPLGRCKGCGIFITDRTLYQYRALAAISKWATLNLLADNGLGVLTQ